jgi:hypothetical protein
MTVTYATTAMNYELIKHTVHYFKLALLLFAMLEQLSHNSSSTALEGTVGSDGHDTDDVDPTTVWAVLLAVSLLKLSAVHRIALW